jgi:hypothetical protein
VVLKPPYTTVGLPPNLAKTIVRAAFYKWLAVETNNPRIVPFSEPPAASNEIEIPVASQGEEAAGLIDEASGGAYNKKEETAKQQTCVPATECHNGRVFDQYMWSQSINDLDVVVHMEKDVLLKDLDIVFRCKHISVRNRRKKEAIIAGDLPHSIKHSEAIWWLGNHRLEIHLEKTHEIWWDRFFLHEEPLDMWQLDCSRPYEELSEEAQAKIEELRYNQTQKAAGLKTSNEMQLEDTLKKAWDADGSPFSGPFDMSKVKLELP